MSNTPDVSTEQLSDIVAAVAEKLSPRPPKLVWVVTTKLKGQAYTVVFEDEDDARDDAASWLVEMGYPEQANEIRNGSPEEGSDGGDYWASVTYTCVIMKKS